MEQERGGGEEISKIWQDPTVCWDGLIIIFPMAFYNPHQAPLLLSLICKTGWEVLPVICVRASWSVE